ncbi:MAG: ATP synthase F1 subunit epsilon [Chthoniobacterales bacterium]
MAKLKLEIVTPEEKAYSDDVDMVVIPGVEGELGVLPMHVPLMTQLLAGPLRILKDGKQSELVIGNGFAEVTQTTVSILTDMAIEEQAIDEAAAEEALRRAETALKDKSLQGEDLAEVEAALARSLAQLRAKRRRRGG